jgi:hypothetical protein
VTLPVTILAQAAAPAATGWFAWDKLPLLVALAFVVAAVLGSIAVARAGRPIRMRRLAGLDAIEEAVGRATEMGRPVLFVPGIQDMDNIMTVAGVTVLGHVAKVTAGYDAELEVPTSRSIVMAAARETVQSAYLAAGRSDAYDPDRIYYVTDDQFSYVAATSGMIARKRPAACFYFGCFFAESLILAENGNAVGAIQVAGTAETAQLPFFVASCDYTLIGEEFFAASAYLSGEPDQLGTILGQDAVKAAAWAMVLLAAVLGTLSAWMAPAPAAPGAGATPAAPAAETPAIVEFTGWLRGSLGGES